MKKLMNLRFKLVGVTFFIIFISVAIVGAVLYRQTAEIVMQKQSAYVTHALKNASTNIEKTINYAKELSLMLIQSKEVIAVLKADVTDVDEYNKKNLELYYSLMFYAGKKEYVDTIYIKGINGATFVSEYGANTYIPLHIQTEMLEKKGGIVWGGQDNQLYIGRAIMDINKPGQSLGSLKINIAMEAIEKVFDDAIILDSENIVLINEQGSVILSRGAERPVDYTFLVTDSQEIVSIYENAANQEITYFKRIPNSTWTIAITVLKEELIDEIRGVKHLLLFSIVISFCVCIVIVLVFSQYAFLPLKQLAKKVQQMTLSSEKLELDWKNADEIGVISEGMNKMVARVNDLIDQVLVEKMRQKELEIKALQAQIDPHCLYNNFDTAYWMSRMEGAEKTSEILLALSDLYKIKLSTDGGMISVEKEIKHVENYFLIERIRTNNQVAMHLSVDASLLHLQTMSFVLQPLVENAIKHGILPYSAEGDIYITAYAENNMLYWLVEDNGQGVNVRELNCLLKGVDENTTKGLAISNIDKRIKLKFGITYGLHFQVNKDGGLLAIITQPLKYS